MALPATDNFNRASLGANWTQVTGSLHNVEIFSSTEARSDGTSNEAAAYWNADTFADDQYSEVVLSYGDGGVDSPDCGPLVRCHASSEQYYLATCDVWDNIIKIYRNNGGTYTQLGANISATIAINDTIRLEMVGTTLEVFVNDVSQATRTDSTFTSGSPGMWFWRQRGRLDTWEGGNVGAASTIIPVVMHHRQNQGMG